MDDVATWRRGVRVDLVARRIAIEPHLRLAWSKTIDGHLLAVLASITRGVLGFYWPFNGEFDPRPLMSELLAQGWRAALPVVAAKDRPLIYRDWTPETHMVRGILGIMIPDNDTSIVPNVVLAPVVGFDAARYRLGNGGGYFDRTLAVLNPAPIAIGIGFALGRLPTIYPQPHDRPMDVIVTEEGIIR